jgi:protein involved in polysaccharide export with SLBB domain
MKKTGILCCLALAMLALGLAGCSTTPASNMFPNVDMPNGVTITNKLDPALLLPPSEAYVIGSGDRLEIEMQSNPDTRAVVTVGLDGKVYYSLLSGVDISGLTLTEAQARLEQELGKYINHPQITLSLREVTSKHVWIVGRVNKPGTYPLSGTMTLIEAISAAGGTQESPSLITTQDLADLRHSFVMRQGKLVPVDFVRLLEEGDMTQNIYLKPDDFVFLPSSLSQQVYVLGAVTNPRSVPYTDHLTMVSAMANVNGYIKDAYLTHVAILRGSLTQPYIVVVNYQAILKGQAVDVPLEPGDIIYVPLTPYRFLVDYTDLILNSFVSSWSANMGIRAVEGSGNVGIAVPVSNGAATGSKTP